MKLCYMDNAATTKADKRVIDAMLPFMGEKYAVPTSIFSYSLGLKSREAIEDSRKIIAEKLNAIPEEIIFTSGGTESNNMALIGYALKNKTKGSHIISTSTENLSVSKTLEYLKKQGFTIDFAPNDQEGLVDIEKIKDLVTDDTIMIAVQHAGEEIGAIQDIEPIGSFCSEKGIHFHVDACQSFTKIPLDVRKMNISSLSVSANKIHGPKGIGALYLRKGAKINKIMYGGFNEFDLRPGTENVPGIVGFAKAVEISNEDDCRKIAALRDYMIRKLTDEIPHTKINGPIGKKRLCNNVNVSFHYVEGESVLLRLDMKGICVSTGSACFSRSLEMSPTMKAIGNDHELAHGSIRFTLSRFNTKEEVNYVVESLKEIISELRKISPLGKK